MASPGNQHCASCIGTLSFPAITRSRQVLKKTVVDGSHQTASSRRRPSIDVLSASFLTGKHDVKPEVHNVSQRQQRSQDGATSGGITHGEFRETGTRAFWAVRANRQTDRQTRSAQYSARTCPSGDAGDILLLNLTHHGQHRIRRRNLMSTTCKRLVVIIIRVTGQSPPVRCYPLVGQFEYTPR